MSGTRRSLGECVNYNSMRDRKREREREREREGERDKRERDTHLKAEITDDCMVLTVKHLSDMKCSVHDPEFLCSKPSWSM